MPQKQPMRALKPFNRNLDGGMIVGHPRHRSFAGRYPLVSAAAADELERRQVAEKISWVDYTDAESAYNEAGGFVDGDAAPAAPKTGIGDRPKASQVRQQQTGDAGGGEANLDGEPKVNMSKARLREIAGARKIDLAAFDAARTNADRVKLIKAGPDAGRVAGMSTASTNHPAGQGPNADPPTVAGTAGLATAEDAAPTGGGKAEAGAAAE